MCKKFHAHSNAFWKSEIDKTHKNATSNSGSSSHIEIFSVGMKTDKNKTSPSSFQHLMTCYDPKLLQDTSKRTLNWCATAPSYKDILKEKTITRVEDIGVCPGINKQDLIKKISIESENYLCFKSTLKKSRNDDLFVLEWCGVNNSKIVGYESMSLEEPQLFPKVYCEKIWSREYERLSAVNTNQIYDEDTTAKILCTGNYRKVEYRSFKYSATLG